MRSSLGKLRKFALHKNDAKEKRENQPSALLDELVQASKDMQDMRDCYDSLLSAAAATANSAYEFSESLREMGTCLLEKTALNDDEESGKVLVMLGKVQFELQKIVDSYRSHISLTITTPSESLLNELRTVEEMKRQCDEKRDVYEYMLKQQRERRPRSGKGETFTLQQLKEAHDEYDEEATLCVFRLKSLKQGQSLSLLTQAARHHAAQLNFFRKGLKSLEAVESQVRLITEQHHIDYQFSGLEDDDGDDQEDDAEKGDDSNVDGELSFDYRQNKQVYDAVSTSRNSMEVDQLDLSFHQASKQESTEAIIDKNQGDYQALGRENKVGSQSAPIFAEKKFDPSEKVRQMQKSSTRKFHTYVLPTPNGANASIPSRTSNSAPRSRPAGHNLWHSSPLEQKKHNRYFRDDNSVEPTISKKSESILRESNSNNKKAIKPPPLAEELSRPQPDLIIASDTKKIKRLPFSGPLTSKPWSSSSSSLNKPIIASPKVSPNASPPLVSSPKINELHELPRPPLSLATKPARSSALIGHSAPLAFRSQELSSTNRYNTPLASSNAGASPLPTPPVPRSFSIPSSSQRTIALHVEEAASPPLTPISLANVKSMTSTATQVASQSGQSRVE